MKFYSIMKKGFCYLQVQYIGTFKTEIITIVEIKKLENILRNYSLTRCFRSSNRYDVWQKMSVRSTRWVKFVIIYNLKIHLNQNPYFPFSQHTIIYVFSIFSRLSCPEARAHINLKRWFSLNIIVNINLTIQLMYNSISNLKLKMSNRNNIYTQLLYMNSFTVSISEKINW